MELVDDTKECHWVTCQIEIVVFARPNVLVKNGCQESKS